MRGRLKDYKTKTKKKTAFEQPCWYCKNACNDTKCTWVAYGMLPLNTDASPKTIKINMPYSKTFAILECPNFERDVCCGNLDLL